MRAPTAQPDPSSAQVMAALVIAMGGAAAILGAYFFQYVIKLAPCPLCLEQRIPYYVGIPLAVATAFAAWRGAPRPVAAGGFALLVVAMLLGAALGAYHAGVEWKWWEGPRDCSGGLGALTSGGSLLDAVATTSVVRCDEAAWRFLGLSLAGYNVLVSLALAAVAIWGLCASLTERRSAP